MIVDMAVLARALHEMERRAVEEGKTVAAEKHGEKTRTFIEWENLPQKAREGRMQQAQALAEEFIVIRQPDTRLETVNTLQTVVSKVMTEVKHECNDIDMRLYAIGKTQLELGFLAFQKAIGAIPLDPEE